MRDGILEKIGLSNLKGGHKKSPSGAISL